MELIGKTRVQEVHASLRSQVKSQMEFQGRGASMGNSGSGEFSWLETDAEKVRRVVALMDREHPLLPV